MRVRNIKKTSCLVSVGAGVSDFSISPDSVIFVLNDFPRLGFQIPASFLPLLGWVSLSDHLE